VTQLHLRFHAFQRVSWSSEALSFRIAVSSVDPENRKRDYISSPYSVADSEALLKAGCKWILAWDAGDRFKFSQLEILKDSQNRSRHFYMRYRAFLSAFPFEKLSRFDPRIQNRFICLFHFLIGWINNFALKIISFWHRISAPNNAIEPPIT